jgi:hypothetical protein
MSENQTNFSAAWLGVSVEFTWRYSFAKLLQGRELEEKAHTLHTTCKLSQMVVVLLVSYFRKIILSQ